MPLFDKMDHGRDPLASLDLLDIHGAAAVGRSAETINSGDDSLADGWASLGVGLGDHGFGDPMVATEGFGDGIAPSVLGQTTAIELAVASPAWMGGASGFAADGSWQGFSAGLPAWEFAPGLDSGAGNAEPMADNAVQGEPAVMFIGGFDFAKGGNGGGGGNPGGGGGGGGSGGGDPNVLGSYTSAGAYNIDISFKGDAWTVALQQAFIDAADLLSNIITADVADVFYRGKVIDDIKIDAELVAIDGEGGVLGQAGPTAVRTANYLPATAIMQFDTADATAMNTTDPATDVWEEVVLHEMLHSIGFGSIWSFLGLVDDSGADPVFTGLHAQAAAGGTVAVEGDGGAGTALSHWDDATYGSEIMTGYLYGVVGTNPDGTPILGNPSNVDADLAAGTPSLTDDASVSDLSNMTIASLEDLGYQTIWPDNDTLFA